ncbi:MAG: aminotransferase class I/II-fold pyridoxal phosphate-dependent enzyme [Thermodesulfobacteriota bacterium]|nr:aminotransferase class I/II-fold pyridoxal phosphate-dependent enzyme [Thermodesulfobacteriota bacterium]
MKELKEWFVPWLMSSREYNTDILDKPWKNPDHARLMLNENPMPPSDKVVKAVAEAVKNGNRYPDSMKRLRTKIGKMYDLGPDNVALCNGSSEIIDSMMRIFLKPGDEIIMSDPTFGLFPPRAELCGGKVVQIPVLENDLQYDVEGMLGAINEKTKLILIINPNNPTGVFIDDADLERFCETGIPLCIDEAYLDYHPEISSKAPLIKKYPQVFLSVTLSKAHGFAGVRFGYVLGTEEMVSAFKTMFLPWNVSLMSMAAAEAILDNPEEVAEKVKHNNRWMDIFYEEARKLGLKPYAAHGNYMLIDASMTGKTTAEILEASLKMEKVFLKKISPIHGKNGYFRVTPGLDEENERFLKFIRAYFG